MVKASFRVGSIQVSSAVLDGLTERLLHAVLIAFCILFFNAGAMLICRCCRRSSGRSKSGTPVVYKLLRIELPGDGLLTDHHLGHFSRGSSALAQCLVGVPAILTLVTMFFGVVMAGTERLGIDGGIFYVAFALGTSPVQLVQVELSNWHSKIVVIILSLFGFVVVNLIMGITSVCRQVMFIALKLPPTFAGFLLALLVLLPLSLVITFVFLACIVAIPEKWALVDSFFTAVDFSITGGNLGLQHASISTLDALTMLIIMQCLLICLIGTMLGIIGAHPFMARCLAFIEGEDADSLDGAPAQGTAESKQGELCWSPSSRSLALMEDSEFRRQTLLRLRHRREELRRELSEIQEGYVRPAAFNDYDGVLKL